MKGYLVNDKLTCIPDTKTFWHDLLEWIPSLEDKTSGSFKTLPNHIERLPNPDYIIRNATFFRSLNTKCRTISLLQDVYEGGLRSQQIEVCSKSDITVFNSPYTAELYKKEKIGDFLVIPLGTDFNHFKPIKMDKIYDIIFVGSTNEVKGFKIIKNIIQNKNLKFCLVMKDNFTCNLPNVTVYNKVNHDFLLKLYNQSKMLVCTSVRETLHLAGMEAAACNIPLLTTNVGAYYNLPDGKWGKHISNDILEDIIYILNNLDYYESREYFLNKGMDKESCKNSWINLINA
jgi:glycosyltransferase involved in cell wall biosynthesis